ncbi:hypothetical protein [Alkalibacillus salilacus]|uniref:Uncharacterized protein n=1 Tax=Alkalibacillus salilacus TaxID=284582 RepID=A0ABT9VHL3_9BACI|nr:hypothetical protein [Alkalibacillus salilacus]MDQ0160449.1 hypothetical protein [Alkalibacillus salilacus]
MGNQKVLLSIILILIISNIIVAYRGFELNKELEQSNQVIDSTVWNEFNNLLASLHKVSEELAQYDASMNEEEMDLYLSSLEKEESRLNELGMNLSYIFNSRNQDKHTIYEEHIWIIEDFISKVSEGEVTDETKIQHIAKIIDEQQNQFSDLFYSDNSINAPEANEDENIRKIVKILDVIVGEINKS